MAPSAHCRVPLQADLRIRHLRLSTIKKCPHMLSSDHRGLRNRDLKLMWVVVGGGWWWWWWVYRAKAVTSLALVNLAAARGEKECRDLAN